MVACKFLRDKKISMAMTTTTPPEQLIRILVIIVRLTSDFYLYLNKSRNVSRFQFNFKEKLKYFYSTF